MTFTFRHLAEALIQGNIQTILFYFHVYKKLFVIYMQKHTVKNILYHIFYKIFMIFLHKMSNKTNFTQFYIFFTF